MLATLLFASSWIILGVCDDPRVYDREFEPRQNPHPSHFLNNPQHPMQAANTPRTSLNDYSFDLAATMNASTLTASHLDDLLDAELDTEWDNFVASAGFDRVWDDFTENIRDSLTKHVGNEPILREEPIDL